MKHSLLTAFATLFLALTGTAMAEGPLPFPVKVDGQAAVYTPGQAFAHLDKPVASDAAFLVETKAEMIIINIHKAKPDGSPDETVQPAIIFLQGTDKGTLAQTMDQRKFSAGKYLLSITAGEATASIQFEIK